MIIPIRIRLTPDTLRLAKQLGLKRSGSMNDRDTPHSHNPKMNSKVRHITGAEAEYVYSDHSGDPVDTWTIGKGDDGTDFPGGVDVKGSKIENMPNLLIDQEAWERKIPKIYVLVWVQNLKFKRLDSLILGWITREQADEVKYEVLEGERGCVTDNWWIDFEYLHPMSELIIPAPAKIWTPSDTASQGLQLQLF